MDTQSYGLALSGDGARSFAHIGVFKALEEFGIQPEVISGTSMGAVLGAFIAAGYTFSELSVHYTRGNYVILLMSDYISS